jgi:hypothetical protein
MSFNIDEMEHSRKPSSGDIDAEQKVDDSRIAGGDPPAARQPDRALRR